ncbi:acyltransferase 3 [Klebsiella quasipneumoniae]|uniref:acyltransferase family protein n=1 Tax=Klebsiella quasipneumoniae TaxID=1463165 RepID=UPI0007CC3DCE|nr:acyltransferase [Klebsiella quasipneumoniae]SAT20874.1 acyltransferase 3 [Klebsiella quasipneumoniae]
MANDIGFNKNSRIQTLRGIAALSVVVDHTLTQFNIYYHLEGITGGILRNLQGIGTIGVYVFFIVSGYIMSLTTFNKTWDKKASSVFLKKRIIRIYPIYWFWLTLLLVAWFAGLALKQHHYSFEKIVSSYLLLPYSDEEPSKINPVLGQGWTLIYEMFFYIFFSILILTNIPKRKVLIVSFLFFSLVIVLGKGSITGIPYIDFFISSKLFYFFVFGIFIYNYCDKIINLFSSVISMYLSISICFVLFFVIALGIVPEEFSKVAMVFFAIIFFLVWFSKGSCNKYLVILGDSSYSLYLCHTFIVMGFGVVCKKFDLSMMMLSIIGMLTIILSVIVGLCSYFLLEKKLHAIFIQKKTTSNNAF